MKYTCIYKGIEFETNDTNNGLFIWTSQGAGYDWNRKTKQYVPSKRLKQISGTCDFSASSDKNLYQKVAKKYKNIDKNMID